MEIETEATLARLTTIGTGGPAAAFARPESVSELEAAIAWAAKRGLEIRTVGLGSNLLAADGGVDALVLRLAGDLAAVEVDGELLRAGGGATKRRLTAAWRSPAPRLGAAAGRAAPRY